MGEYLTREDSTGTMLPLYSVDPEATSGAPLPAGPSLEGSYISPKKSTQGDLFTY